MNRIGSFIAAASALVISLATATALHAVGTMYISDETEEDFQAGELKSTTLSSDGVLTIAPALDKPVETGEPVVWDVAPAPDGSFYISTGHEAKVFRHAADGATSPTLVADLKEVEATALALSQKGELLIGASPGGTIYRAADEDKPTTLTKLADAYVWDLISDGDRLYAATGAKGNIYSIDPAGKSQLLLETKTANVLALERCDDGTILAATEDPGLLLQLNPADRSVKVLLDGSPYSEVREVVCGKDGQVYAVLNGRGQSSPDAARIEALRAALGTLASPGSPMPPTAPSRPARQQGGAPDLESQIVKINPNGFVQTIWFAPESPIHSLYYDKQQERLYAGVGEKGLLFEIRDNGKYSRALQLDQRSIMALVGGPESIFVGTAEAGAVYRLSRKAGVEGVYLSEPFDAGDPVQWGALHVKATTPEGTTLTLALRRGNSGEPNDRLWSQWSAEQSPVDGYVRFEGPPARFVQYRATLRKSAPTAQSPSLDMVEAFYLTPNLAPVIRDVMVGLPSQKPSQQQKTPTLANILLQAEEEAEEEKESKNVAPDPNSNPPILEIRWEVEEPNEDNMQFDVYFKGEQETTWKKINKEPVKDKTSYPLATLTIPDGEYRARVVASDLPSNPPELASESEDVSDRFYVDHTPPEVKILDARQTGPGKILLQVRAYDATTLIADAKYNVDAGEWHSAFPADRVFDGETETLDITIEVKEPGEHTITVLVSDRKGNTALAKRVVNATP